MRKRCPSASIAQCEHRSDTKRRSACMPRLTCAWSFPSSSTVWPWKHGMWLAGCSPDMTAALRSGTWNCDGRGEELHRPLPCSRTET